MSWSYELYELELLTQVLELLNLRMPQPPKGSDIIGFWHKAVRELENYQI